MVVIQILAGLVAAFGIFCLLARLLPPARYRRLSRALAVAPSAVWVGFGISSNLIGMIVLFAFVLAAALWAVAALAGRLVQGRVQ